MEQEFVSYEQAVALKELGFDGDYLKVYSTKWQKILDEEYAVRYDVDYAPAPLKQQVFRWFRENHNMLANVYSNASGFLFEYHDTIGGTHRLDSGFTGDCELSGTFTTYEEAENACIDKLIELAKQQDNV